MNPTRPENTAAKREAMRRCRRCWRLRCCCCCSSSGNSGKGLLLLLPGLLRFRLGLPTPAVSDALHVFLVVHVRAAAATSTTALRLSSALLVLLVLPLLLPTPTTLGRSSIWERISSISSTSVSAAAEPPVEAAGAAASGAYCADLHLREPEPARRPDADAEEGGMLAHIDKYI